MMDASFWHQKWESNDIAFHQAEANPLLVKYFHELPLTKGGRMFLPLCGKTRDIAWLLSKGYRVAGAELSEIAIQQLFQGLGVEPQIVEAENLQRYSADSIDIFCGDIFNLSSTMLGPVDAIYDRAALVALPKEMRGRYTAHLMKITATAPQLLICYDYDQHLMAGPPFSISNQEVRQHYVGRYALRLIASTDVPGGLKGTCAAKENTWLLPKN